MIPLFGIEKHPPDTRIFKFSLIHSIIRYLGSEGNTGAGVEGIKEREWERERKEEEKQKEKRKQKEKEKRKETPQTANCKR